MQRRVAQLAGIVRRDVGRHADGDAGGAVGEQVGEIAGSTDGSSRARRSWAEVDRVLVDAVEELRRDAVSRASV